MMRLLVIEDYEPLRRSLVRGLGEAGFAVDATGDGKEGLWFAEDACYDAVILDLMLPGMDGMTILQRMRDGGKTSPVLILTARDGVPDRVNGLNSGADDYLVKPFAFEELLARVNALVRRKYDVPVTQIEAGGLSIDLNARTARWPEGEVALTAKEYGILEVLALHHGRVVSRTEITEHLYGFDAEPNSNSIDVHIAQLRRKIEARGKPRRVHTRRGMGYILMVQDAVEPPCAP
ncbi:response regulator transcription factor [Phycisphaeraceae bacterium D3-23]